MRTSKKTQSIKKSQSVLNNTIAGKEEYTTGNQQPIRGCKIKNQQSEDKVIKSNQAEEQKEKIKK